MNEKHETPAEFCVRWKPTIIAWESGQEPSVFTIRTLAIQAIQIVKAEVERKKAEAPTINAELLAACKTTRTRLVADVGEWPSTVAMLDAAIAQAEAERKSELRQVDSEQEDEPVEAERKPPVSLDKDAAEIMRLRAELADKDDALARLTGRGLYAGGPPAVTLDEALDALVTVLKHWFSAYEDCQPDSVDVPVVAASMRLLARAGHLVIDSDDGKNRVIGHWKEKAEGKVTICVQDGGEDD